MNKTFNLIFMNHSLVVCRRLSIIFSSVASVSAMCACNVCACALAFIINSIRSIERSVFMSCNDTNNFHCYTIGTLSFQFGMKSWANHRVWIRNIHYSTVSLSNGKRSWNFHSLHVTSTEKLCAQRRRSFHSLNRADRTTWYILFLASQSSYSSRVRVISERRRTKIITFCSDNSAAFLTLPEILSHHRQHWKRRKNLQKEQKFSSFLSAAFRTQGKKLNIGQMFFCNSWRCSYRDWKFHTTREFSCSHTVFGWKRENSRIFFIENIKRDLIDMILNDFVVFPSLFLLSEDEIKSL